MKSIPSLFLICSLLLLLGPRLTQAIEHPAISDSRVVVAKDEFSLLRNERIGDLQIGLSEAKVTQAISCTLNREPEKLWGADGAYHQTWKYADCGITLDMVSQKSGAPKSIASITLTNPSRLSTTRGIGIGSTAEAVMNAYQSEWNREGSRSDIFIAGSIYGGLIINFQNGTVSKIFLGAAAE